MKYISMKMDPKGRSPPRTEITSGVRYHFFAGMGRGMDLTRQGLSGAPAAWEWECWVWVSVVLGRGRREGGQGAGRGGGVTPG